MAIDVETTRKALMDTAPVGFNPEQADYVARLLVRLEETKDSEIEKAESKTQDAYIERDAKVREADRLYDKLIEARVELNVLRREHEQLQLEFNEFSRMHD